MYQLKLKPRAILMQKEAYDWYEKQQAGLGERFLEELDKKYASIQSLPEVYSKREREYRHATLKKFPYAIVFKIFKEVVVVFAVFHSKRNPKNKLRTRKK